MMLFAMIVIPATLQPILWLAAFLGGLGGILLAKRALSQPGEERKPDPSKAVKVPVGKGRTLITRKRQRWQDRVVKEEELPRDCDGNIIEMQDDWFNATRDLKL